MDKSYDKTIKNVINAGVIAKSFPIAAGCLKLNDSTYVTYYGRNIKITRIGNGKYDFSSKFTDI